jgi:GT2 family glycosyltransferase
MSARFGCVIITGGARPDDLHLALTSLLAQRGIESEIVVVGNGCRVEGLPAGVRTVSTPTSVGIPAARNVGPAHVAGDLLFFLDDDASVRDPDALRRIAEAFDADPRLGLLQLRVDPRGPGAPLREWVPRLRSGDPGRSSDVTVVWEGAVAMRRSVFEEVGGWPADFRFVHEGVDLGWRVMDAGHRIRYCGDIVALHPTPAPGAAPARHGYTWYYGARNRVWLARRHLPLPLGALYVTTFAVRTVPRLRRRADARQALRGYRDGFRHHSGPRRPLRARTLWRMTRAGRPPVL